ncbi:A1 cistron-splicing factor [Tirmania nivea]|nr:A1 cistron-splicing factor [Tirmania nivea]
MSTTTNSTTATLQSSLHPPSTAPAPHLTTLLLLSLPPSTFLSLDLFSFTTSPTPQTHPFHGIKLLLSGLHYLSISPGPLSDFSLRTGIWFHASGAPGSVLALKWDERRGELVLVGEEDECVGGWERWVRWWYEGSLVEYRSRGGAGVQEVGDSRVWRALVGAVGEGTLRRVLGPGEEEVSVRSGVMRVWRVESASSAGQDWDDEILKKIPLPHGSQIMEVEAGASDHDQTLNLLPIDLKRTFPPNATGRERTLAAQDRSWYLNQLVNRYLVPHSHPPPVNCIVTIDPGSRELLGELELCFIHALTLSNFSCAEAYVRTLALCLTCEERILTNREFYHRLIEVLIMQLGQGLDCFAPPDAVAEEQDYGEEGGAGGNAWVPDWLIEGPTPVPKLLRGFWRILKRLLAESELEVDRAELVRLLEGFGRLEKLVEERFGWVVDTGKVVKRGMVMLEDGEMVELELTGLLGEEEDEEGEGPVVVEM